MKTAFATLLSLSLGISFTAAASEPARTAPQPVDQIARMMFRVRSFHAAAISPDGTRVAYSVDTVGKTGEPDGKSAIHVALSGGSAAARRICAGPAEHDYDEREFAWSPDGRRLAFLSDAAKPGQRQLYVAEMTTPSAGQASPSVTRKRKLTNLTGYLAEPSWTPDGRSIALLFTENAPRASGPLQPMTPDAGIVDGHIYEQRIAIVDADTAATRIVTPGDIYVYHYAWSPDGKRIAAIAAPGSGDNNWWIAQLYVLDLVNNSFTPIYKPRLQIADPRFSPDGKWIALIGGLMSDEGATGGDVWIVASDGSEARNLTPGMKASATSVRWMEAGRIHFVENVDGHAGLATVTTGAEPRIETLWDAPEHITVGGSMSISFARDGVTSAVIRSSFTRPPEVAAGRVGAWSTITNLNAPAKAAWKEPTRLHWASDGLQVQGWLLAPAEPRLAREGRSPMVVFVHGGPAGAVASAWPHPEAAALVERGYYAFYPNPRGSYGQGEAFTQGNVKDFGYGDLRDIMNGVDAVTRDFPVDSKRLGMWGWSYGGYMGMWTVTQTNRFAAVVAGAGIANWQSYYGENDIDEWMIPYFGASVYDDPAVYAKSSPIAFIKSAKTPTLILAGDRDGEVPVPQSYELWHALKTLGVPTRLVVYANEGHRIAKRQNRIDIMQQTLEWFATYLK